MPRELADAEARLRMTLDAPTQPIPSSDQVAALHRQMHDAGHAVRADEQLFRLAEGPTDLLDGYMQQKSRSDERQIENHQRDLDRLQQRYDLLQHLQREYQRKGSAAVFTFSVSSNVQLVDDPSRFQSALRSIVSELHDQHRFQIRQKLQGGRLNIQIAEAKQPLLCWIEQWLGGALSPTQLQRLAPASNPYRRLADEHLIVTPDEPIEVDGHTRHPETKLAARYVNTGLASLDIKNASEQKDMLNPKRMKRETIPLWIGQRLDESGNVIAPVALPLSEMVHGVISGTTGAGKSFLARVLVEEAVSHEELSVMVIDPRNQFAGMLIAEDRQAILQRYAEFSMNPKQARGFSLNYFAPALNWTMPLPPHLGALAAERSIISFKALDSAQRCDLAADILDAVFENMATAESTSPKLFIVVDEAQLFTQKRVDGPAKHAASRAERAIDRIAREGRKYGLVLMLVSQTIKDFSHQLASLRQMASTKIFLRNSDLEIQYADDILGDGRRLVDLPTGVALLHNANWGIHRISIRPPYSKVFELDEPELRRLLQPSNQRLATITAEARNLLLHIRTNVPGDGTAMNLTRLARVAGINSRRRLHELVGELERAGIIRTRVLPERGRPRVIEWVDGSGNATD